MSDAIEIGIDDSLKVSGDPTKLYEALAKASVEFVPVPKKRLGQAGGQKFNYAGYATIVRCVRPALAKHGIAFLQPLHFRDGLAVTTTILAGHGASLSTSFSFRSDFSKKQKDGTVVPDPQEFGRNHTYYRRYQLQAILGIEGDADADDLPDVNESQEDSSYVEPAPKAAAKSAPKASAEPKPAPVPTSETGSPAVVSEPKPNGASNGKRKLDNRPVNAKLADAMKQLNWSMGDFKSFYVEHIDGEGFEKSADIPVELKEKAFLKLVELKGISPF